MSLSTVSLAGNNPSGLHIYAYIAVLYKGRRERTIFFAWKVCVVVRFLPTFYKCSLILPMLRSIDMVQQ